MFTFNQTCKCVLLLHSRGGCSFIRGIFGWGLVRICALPFRTNPVQTFAVFFELFNSSFGNCMKYWGVWSPKEVVAEDAKVSMTVLHCCRAVCRVARSFVRNANVLHCPTASSMLFCILYTCFPSLVLLGSKPVVVDVVSEGKSTSEWSSSVVLALQIAVQFSS